MNEELMSEYLQAKMLVSHLKKKLERKTNQANHLGTGHKKLCHIQDKLDMAQEVQRDCLARITEYRKAG
ncbi:MAG: hypothetical protein H9W81_12355 [Enterococcus sp.]|nr:hypothetical protein [Enterococcus sp.]